MSDTVHPFLVGTSYDKRMSWLIRLIINLTCQKNLWSDLCDDFGLQVLSEKTTLVVKFIYYMSLQSQFVYRLKAIAKLYTSIHLSTRQRLKPKHMLRNLFETLQVFLEQAHSNIYVTFTITELIVPIVTKKLRWTVCRWWRSQFCLSNIH